MEEITVLSGKGGTGKTTITAAFASLANNLVLCDNDVDAADLHIILNPTIEKQYLFSSGATAAINEADCVNCGLCIKHCRFGAISLTSKNKTQINAFKCEGCKLCERICPTKAIESKQNLNNHWYVSSTRFGAFVHAKMGPGEENSGKLVTQIRKCAKEIALDIKADFVLNDGPPGIGCSAISSISGTNRVLLVIEPTMTGLHDAKRLIALIKSFKIQPFALINKFDINLKLAASIEQYLYAQNIPLLGKIPFDKKVVEAMIERKTIIEYDTESDISLQLKSIWWELTAKL